MLIAQFLRQKTRTLNRSNIFSSNQWYHTSQIVKFIIIHINVTCGLLIQTLPTIINFISITFWPPFHLRKKKPNKQNKADKNHSFTRKIKFILQTAAAAATPLVSSKRNALFPTPKSINFFFCRHVRDTTLFFLFTLVVVLFTATCFSN